jgi:hypothetical protein
LVCSPSTDTTPTGHYVEQCSTAGSGKGARKNCKQVWVPYRSEPIPLPRTSQVQQPSVAPIVDITAAPSIVRLGGSSRITWNGGLADKCSVVGPNFTASTIRGSQVVSNLQEQSTYTLNCSKGTASAQDTARVDILPLWREY